MAYPVKKPRVLLGDDHTILLEGLRTLLEPEFHLVGTAKDGRAVLSATAELHPDVVVLDVSMPLLNGIEVARQLRKTHANLKIVFLTMHPDIPFVVEEFRLGASGYVLKRRLIRTRCRYSGSNVRSFIPVAAGNKRHAGNAVGEVVRRPADIHPDGAPARSTSATG